MPTVVPANSRQVDNALESEVPTDRIETRLYRPLAEGAICVAWLDAGLCQVVLVTSPVSYFIHDQPGNDLARRVPRRLRHGGYRIREGNIGRHAVINNQREVRTGLSAAVADCPE